MLFDVVNSFSICYLDAFIISFLSFPCSSLSLPSCFCFRVHFPALFENLLHARSPLHLELLKHSFALSSFELAWRGGWTPDTIIISFIFRPSSMTTFGLATFNYGGGPPISWNRTRARSTLDGFPLVTLTESAIISGASTGFGSMASSSSSSSFSHFDHYLGQDDHTFRSDPPHASSHQFESF